MAAHRQPAYAGKDTGTATLDATEHLTDTTLILPLYHQLTQQDQARVIDSVYRASRAAGSGSAAGFRPAPGESP